MKTDKLFEVSLKIGKRVPHWTQGSGGNVSLKEGKSLLIKASGIRLDSVNKEESLARVDIASAKKAIDQIDGNNFEAEKMYSAALTGSRKPSMETGMHLGLPRPWVFHFHSLAALAMAHENGKDPDRMKKWVERNFPFTHVFIEPVRPGLVLSQRIRPLSSTALLVLENHGVLIQGSDVSILDAWEEMEDKFKSEWSYTALSRVRLNKPTPWRLYFPDSAVFADRLKKILEPAPTAGNEPFFLLKKDAEKTDLDAAELWWATEILYAACPELKQLPASIAGILPDLPTEQYRRGETN